ncbi:PAS domain S-box protein [Devosia sediminis]|uniref:Sensor protein FixL n=1 Tax=Devosia sediminis TaxID=2798801 RepID=A0A934IUU1_9HYPH|nr:PAS domain S-box protein [Devosia sediminis]MBJ3783163.1 PAS domain S-box protein [Devosia sediminis]
MTHYFPEQADLVGQARKLQAILESAVDAIITIDGRGTITTVNPAAARLFDYPQDAFIGQNVHFLMPEPYHSAHDGYIANYRRTGAAKIIGIGREVTGRRRDGSLFPMHLAVSEFEMDGRVHFTGIIHDLSAQKATEQALRQAQKMEAMGQLTGGIAHDFNNLLTVIIGNLEMLEAKLTTSGQRELAIEALEAADLGARLTARLLAFARRSHLEPEVVNLNDFVLGLTDMLHRTMGSTISLSNALTPRLWMTRIDPSQVESAIVNLAVNARDAMPQGGRLIIETGNVSVDAAMSEDLDGLAPGDYVRLSVADTGEGMPADVRERAFEPFFTTKEKGRGTGLGLSMIYGFAKQSGGHATIYSEIGRGTSVNIYLPRHGTASAVEAEPEEAAVPPAGKTVLVVEDDPRVRKLTVTRLETLGYATLVAADAHEALAILGRGAEVDLVFTDLVMPGGISGYELARRVAEQWPGLNVLLTSGYADELVRRDEDAIAHLKVLSKPYRMADLAQAIAEALEG